MGDERERVAILGGGAGGLTTAFELTDPALAGRYDITVYQLGWRLGGKGASGRRPGAGHAIEEHGLHIWFGFYDNAFDLIQRCYAELDRPAGAALRTWQDTFEECRDIVLYNEGPDGGWQRHRWCFPRNEGIPGAAGEHTFHEVVERAIDWLRQELPDGHEVHLPGFERLLEEATEDTGKVLGKLVDFGLDRLRDTVWEVCAHDLLPSAMREFAMIFDLFITMIRGILADDLVEKGFGSINDEELSAWLRRHDVKDETLERSPMLRSFYQLCFAYTDGDRARPEVAAGKAVQALLRIAFTYEGAIMWKMRAGMGDAIFAPLYELLRARGVRFAFFHQAERLRLDDGGERVAEIDVIEQARPAGDSYAPLCPDPGGLACWPNEPLWEQLADGEALRARVTNFEREAQPPGATRRTLRLGEDFDHVVLAIPPGAQRPLCDELVERGDRFATMLGAARTVGTQALQVWLNADRIQLGWDYERETVSGAYATPLDTYADMSHVLADREDWPESDDVRHVAYFCGVMEDRDGETQDEADARAQADGEAHLSRHGAALWPGIADGDGIRPDAVVARYTRANVGGSERYVLTPPGSVERRLRADESGFANLLLAGDWTRNGICGGSVEAAVTSGRMAARALSGRPERIPGLEGWLESD